MPEGARGPMAERVPVQTDDFETDVIRRMAQMISVADREEESRRRSDRIGGNLYYGRHWQVLMPKNRTAITANVTKALIDHKIAIMTKQRPIPVVEPDDYGDVDAAMYMRAILQRNYYDDDMDLKGRQALRLANTTRTCAAKTMWDPEMKKGIGDVTTDIIPGWRLILDPRTRFPERMEFLGDRAMMSRSRAMVLYPEAAAKIKEGGEYSNKIFSGGSGETPIRSPFSRIGVDFAANAGPAIVNGNPVITAFTGISARGSAGPEKEVQIVELYYRDRTKHKKMVPVEDPLGDPVRRIVRDKDGAPQFDRTDEIDDILGEPGYKLVYEDVMEEKLVPIYPSWRRTTLLYPDLSLLDDRAWDAPQPYSLLLDNEPLEGAQAKGSALDVEDLQSAVNVSLSTMMDNLRFSSYRAFKASVGAQIEKNNLVISPGDIIRTGQDVNQFVPLEFPQLSEAWFQWLNQMIALMERVIGASGIMQGSASEAPRTDSAAGFDSLAEIGGSRIVECTQRFEKFISEIYEKVGWYAQRYYTEAHAIAVENAEGQLTYERASSPQLAGTFSYKVAVGSTLAWNESGVRARVLQEMGQGLRDKISVWKKLNIEDWQAIRKRMETQNPALNPPPPPRTRQQLPKNGRAAVKAHG